MEIKLAIVGTRNPKLSYKEWESLLLQEVSPDDLALIVSGGATGIDTYAKLQNQTKQHRIIILDKLKIK